MSDDADIAFEIETNRLAAALANRVLPSVRTSATHCEECGDDIPHARRVAVPGCQCCVGCEAINEEANQYRMGRRR